jgi:tetratricopeptide (TPR) repeat protein
MRPGLSAEQRYEAHTNRAYRLTELGRQQEASADYTAVIELPGIPAPDTANARVGRGMCVRQLADPDAALEDFQAVIDMDGATAEARGAAYGQRAQIHQERKDFDLAHADFTVVTEMTGISESARGESYANRGWGSYLQGDFDALLADSEAAVKLAPDEPYIGYNLAFAYFIHGRNDAARRQYETVLGGAPNADAIQAAITDLEEVGEYVPDAPDSKEFLALLRDAASAQSEPASA